jgi:isopenicillin-N N-acyltransferase-like protein
MPFPFIEASGTPFEMGQSHGEQARDQIRAFVDYLIRNAGRPRDGVLRATHRFLPLFERYCPALLEEVEGLAAGAGLTLEEALLPQIRGEIQGVLPEHACTTFAVDGTRSATGGTLIGQTSDMAAELEQYFVVLRLCPDTGPRLLMWSFAGQLGYHGLSEYGVAHFANSVSGGPPPGTTPGGLPHYPVKRRLYECRSRAEVMEMWRVLPVCSSGNYMLATPEPAIFDVEATPAGVEVLEPVEGVLAHANHFLHPRWRTEATDALSLPDSFQRQARIEELLRSHEGRITLGILQNALADHHGYPCSICRHEHTGDHPMVTVAALIAEPVAGFLHVARGRPCQREWNTYQV